MEENPESSMAYNGGEGRLKGLKSKDAEVLLGQVLTGELWNLAIYGKGLLHQTFLDHRHWASGKFHLPVLVMSSSFGSHGGGGRGKIWFQGSWRSRLWPVHMPLVCWVCCL